MKDSGWRFEKIKSMTVYFHKTGEINRRSYVKISLISNATLNIENNDKYCFLWSILAYLHPCNNNHSNRVSNYRKYFKELGIEGFDFTNGFKCSGVHKYEKLNNIPFKILEVNIYQDQNKGRHNLIPIEISKDDSE